MIPKSETLPCGYRVVPYIYQRKFNFEISQRDMSLCDNALNLMQKEMNRSLILEMNFQIQITILRKKDGMQHINLHNI